MPKNDNVSSERTRLITVEKQYLNLPVQRNAPKTWIRLLDGDTILREFDIELAGTPEETDFWVTLDLSQWAGQALTLWVDNIRPGCRGFEMITQADGIMDSKNLYQEKYRPQFRFSPKRGWLNDPNGLVCFDNEYHLFFQHNPYGCTWGNMTWGHAVSKDLLHWEELGDAIHPDGFGTIFSGSAVVDWHNSTGFQRGDAPPLVAIFTYDGGRTLWSKGAKATQGIAYSNDRGRTWTKYAGNPVQEHLVDGNRDPKVFWHAPTGKWVMVLFLDKTQMALFTSDNLKTWHKTQELEAFYECPELFPLPVDGEQDRVKWVLYGGAGEYYIGDFDGERYTPHTDKLRFNYGNCFYGSQTFSDIPPHNGRRIQIGWGAARDETSYGGMPFNQAMNFPVALTLRDTETGPRLYAAPVEEIQLLYKTTQEVENLLLNETFQPVASGDLLDVVAVIDPGETDEIIISMRGKEILYNTHARELRCGDHVALLPLENGCLTLRLLVDRTTVEIFANNGRVYMPMYNHGEDTTAVIQASARNGAAAVKKLTIHTLASAWKQA